jgi:hypothetical protein
MNPTPKTYLYINDYQIFLKPNHFTLIYCDMVFCKS